MMRFKVKIIIKSHNYDFLAHQFDFKKKAQTYTDCLLAEVYNANIC